MKEVLSHYAQFQSWIPFYTQTLDASKKPSAEFYSTTPLSDDSCFSRLRESVSFHFELQAKRPIAEDLNEIILTDETGLDEVSLGDTA